MGVGKLPKKIRLNSIDCFNKRGNELLDMFRALEGSVDNGMVA